MTARVLIVEDDRASRDVFTRILQRAGYEVTAAENGFIALGEVGHDPIGAVLCDLRMPELGGTGFYAVLKELFPEVAARVIFVTAFADDPTIRAFIHRTGQPVIEKPVELEHLVAAVRRMVALPQ